MKKLDHSLSDQIIGIIVVLLTQRLNSWKWLEKYGQSWDRNRVRSKKSRANLFQRSESKIKFKNCYLNLSKNLCIFRITEHQQNYLKLLKIKNVPSVVACSHTIPTSILSFLSASIWFLPCSWKYHTWRRRNLITEGTITNQLSVETTEIAGVIAFTHVALVHMTAGDFSLVRFQ